jgi:hypothetical protein
VDEKARGSREEWKWTRVPLQTTLRNETTNNPQVKTRLDGVKYIFLDEVSMVSCNDN